MSEPVIKIGVIGLGFMGATHLAAWQSAMRAGYPCRMAGVCDADPARRAGRLGAGGNLVTGSATAPFDPAEVRGYERAGDLIDDGGVDLVSICTPTDSHVDLAERAMRAGKHVLVEKPVALTADPVRRLARVAAECGVVCMPAMCMRFWPGWVLLKQAVDDGRFGAVKNVRFTRLGCRPAWSEFYRDPARSGGALVDLHIHDTDFIAHLFGPPESVASTGTVDHLTTIYHYANVPHVAADGGWDQHPSFPFTMRYLVNFEQATLDFDISRTPQLLVHQGGASSAIQLEATTGYDGEIRHFIDCLAEGLTPSVTLEDATVTHAILDVERQSLEKREPVPLPSPQ